MDHSIDRMRLAACKRGLLGAGFFAFLFIIIAVILECIMSHPVLIAGRKLFWLGTATVCVYLFCNRLVLYLGKKQTVYLVELLLSALLFVICATVFINGFFYTGV